MIKITKLKTYFTAPSQCFIPKCKARCCINAPLPEDFLPKHTDKIQRPVYSAVNIGVNDLRDTYNSVIYDTIPGPIQFIGYSADHKKLVGIRKEVLQQMQIKSMEQISALIEEYERHSNYCPFIKNDASCSVYSERPPICREFGTLPDKINQCPEKASRLGIAKIFAKALINQLKKQIGAIKQAFTIGAEKQ